MSIQIGDTCEINNPGERDHGQTGKVFAQQSDGTYLVERGWLDALLGAPAYRADQLKPTNH